MAALWTCRDLLQQCGDLKASDVELAMIVSGVRDRLNTFPLVNCTLRDLVRLLTAVSLVRDPSIVNKMRTPLPEKSMMYMCGRTIEGDENVKRLTRHAFSAMVDSDKKMSRSRAGDFIAQLLTNVCTAILGCTAANTGLTPDPSAESRPLPPQELDDIVRSVVEVELKAVPRSGWDYSAFHVKVVDVALLFSTHGISFVPHILQAVDGFVAAFVLPCAAAFQQRKKMQSLTKVALSKEIMHLQPRTCDSFTASVPSLGVSKVTHVRISENYPLL